VMSVVQDLRTLAIFVKVAERLSFVRAAADLGITQSGVSNAISRLEDQIGTRLIARTTRHVSLTEHGAAFFERCRQALAEIEEAELVLKDAQLKPSGNLRIDLPVSFGRLKVLPLLGTFQAQYPDIKLRVTFNNRYVDLVEEGVDICVRLGQLQDSSLVARRLTGTPYSVVGAPGYFAKYGKPTRIGDLAKHNCLAFTSLETRLARQWHFIEGGVEKAHTPQGAMSFSDGGAVCDAAIAGYGLAQLQGYFADAPIASGTLVAVLEKFKPQLEPVWLVYPQTRHLSPKVRVFVDFMAAQFKGGTRAPRRSTPSRSRAR
jgi:LysR family transcriptional regulator, regulator for bpeEF and oprC